MTMEVFSRHADGLPLRTISDTPNLTRILMSRPDDKTIDVFQDDGAVVEQFRDFESRRNDCFRLRRF